MFNQHDDKAQDIMWEFEIMLNRLKRKFEVKLKDPPHDIAMRFLNEIEEYNMVGE